MDQREFWQYRAGRFSDPDVPEIMEAIEPDKLQRLLAAYASDTNGIYISDPSHAMVSIPFRLVKWALSQESLLAEGVISDEDISYLRKKCHLKRQLLSQIAMHFEILKG